MSTIGYTAAVATRPVLRIFISSTAIDLRDYRDKVRDAVLSLNNLPVAMETFSARPGQPAIECRKMAAEADALICIVAHLYGYVPPKELGGDGEKSITWLEVEAAERACKPVFAYLVDPNALWTGLKEQDRLTSEPPEKVPEILKFVQKLQEFKAHLSREHILGTFISPEDLVAKISIALANHAPVPGHAPAGTTRVWSPLYAYALQPAPHFRGRETKLQELRDWLQAPVTPNRVISVIAAGGTGKTALIEKALRDAVLSDHAGVFVWSFYEDPHMDAFLRTAFLYFTGEKETPTAGLLERLQMALSGDVPHLLVLDGLETVQSEGNDRRRGELEDLQLKRLLRTLAQRGNTRALITSRFPLVDLESFTGAGHRAISLDDLERSAAIDLLRAWAVRGDDATLARVLEPLNIDDSYHPLSVAVLGSYVGNFAEGNPSRAPEFSIGEAEEGGDLKAAKLRRILEQYAKVLTPIERDLLSRLSLFPRGVKIEVLGWIAQAGADTAGALIGLTDRQIANNLARLKALGLVTGNESNQQSVYSAHPFLREFFRGLLRIEPESVHESVRVKLYPNLASRPRSWPSDPAILDEYELLIEETLLAGLIRAAFDLYWTSLGAHRNLGNKLGENVRGIRILTQFIAGDVSLLARYERGTLLNELALFAESLGDLARGRVAFLQSRALWADAFDLADESGVCNNLAELELKAGQFRQALEYSESAVRLAAQILPDEAESLAGSSWRGTAQLSWRAMSHFSLGDVTSATHDFRYATSLQGKPLFSLPGLLEAECKLLRGDRTGARAQTKANRKIAVEGRWPLIIACCDALLARILLPDNLRRATQHLQDARAFAYQSGDVDLQLRCFQAACENHLRLEDYAEAIDESEAAIVLADSCGFQKYSIDLRLVLAEALLATGDVSEGLQKARWALESSEATECSYAWGKSDALHICGMAHLRLQEHELARQLLTAALELRGRLGHWRVEETRGALRKLNRS